MRIFPEGDDQNIFKRRHNLIEWGRQPRNDSFYNGDGSSDGYDFGNGRGCYHRELIQYWR